MVGYYFFNGKLLYNEKSYWGGPPNQRGGVQLHFLTSGKINKSSFISLGLSSKEAWKKLNRLGGSSSNWKAPQLFLIEFFQELLDHSWELFFKRPKRLWQIMFQLKKNVMMVKNCFVCRFCIFDCHFFSDCVKDGRDLLPWYSPDQSSLVKSPALLLIWNRSPKLNAHKLHFLVSARLEKSVETKIWRRFLFAVCKDFSWCESSSELSKLERKLTDAHEIETARKSRQN